MAWHWVCVQLSTTKMEIQNHHLAMLNISTKTGQGCKLTDMLMRCKVDLVCIQETQWKDQKSGNMGEGYKLIYCDVTNQKGIAVAVNAKHHG